jgi:GNAT superfamily N-acetyltransferase
VGQFDLVHVSEPAAVPEWRMLLRPAEPNDAMLVAAVHVRSWQAGYRNLLPESYLDRLRPEQRAQRYDFRTTEPGRPATIVAVEDGVVCGFATTAPARDADIPDHGELCGLYVHPEWWGRGIGAALAVAARARLSGLGFRNAVVWVLKGNARAERFYLNDGWSRDGTQRQAMVWELSVDEVRFRRALEIPAAAA